MNEKMMRTLGIIIACFAAFIIILFFVSSCMNGTYTYERLEERMLEIAQNYYTNNEDELPVSDKDSKTMTLRDMISDGNLDEVTELFDDESAKCDGNVTVTNNNGYYLYSPYLSCSTDDDEYQTTYLKDKIIEDSLVESGVGLYEENGQYIMKGEVTNNFVSYNDKLFRIIRINEDGTIRLLEMSGLSQKKWDDRYNPDTKFNSGINEYEINDIDSRLKEATVNYYNDTTVWPDETKGFITTQSLCIGKRSQADITKDGSTECSQTMSDQTFGSLAVYEYLQASLDPNCDTTISTACRNYNWMSNFQFSTWMITADAESSQYVYVLYQKPQINTASGLASINVVFNLSDKAIYVSGTGTETDPYIFR